MTTARRDILAVGATVIGSMVFARDADGQSNPKLTGAVVSKENSGIEGVLVTAYRGGTKDNVRYFSHI